MLLRPIRFLFAAPMLGLLAARAQTPAIAPAIQADGAMAKQHRHTPHVVTPTEPNLNVVVLDPGHGRQDLGARLGGNLYAKDVNLLFAQKLRSALTARGFTVVLTREADPAPAVASSNPDPTQPTPSAPAVVPLTPDSRAEVANRAHPLVCLLLDSTTAGRGVHLYTSSLTPVAQPGASLDAPRPIQLWDTAQIPFLAQSQRLLADVSLVLRNLDLPILSGSASVSPIDAMSCAAITMEIAPTPVGHTGLLSPADTAYQDRLSHALAEALDTYRSESAASRPKPPLPAPAIAAPPPRPKPKPRPATTPNVPADASGAPAQ